MHIRCPAVQTHDGTPWFCWENSNLCHSDSTWYEPLFPVTPDEADLTGGRFARYREYHSYPEDGIYKNTALRDAGAEFTLKRNYHGDADAALHLEAVIAWIAANTAGLWSITGGPAYGQPTGFWFEHPEDRDRLAAHLAYTPADLEARPVGLATLLQGVPLGDILNREG